MGLPLKDHPMTQIISRLMQLLASDWQTGASADLLRDLVFEPASACGTWGIPRA